MLGPAPFSPLRILFLSGLLLPGGAVGPAATAAIPAPSSVQSQPQAVAGYGKLPLSFEANRGQADPSVRFLARGSGYALFLTGNGAVLALGQSSRQLAGCTASPSSKMPRVMSQPAHCPSPAARQETLRMTLAGAANQGHAVSAAGEELLPGKANYFLGNEPIRWRTGLPTYAKVRYSGVYPGVDLVYYGNQGQLEYDFVIAPGASPKPIQIQFSRAKKVKLTAGGDLTVFAANGQIALHKPSVYQQIEDRRQPVEGRFALLAKNRVGFTLGQYDHSKPLVIDPVLVYSTYLGGSGGGTSASGIAVDSSGDAYVTGSTTSTEFPVTSGVVQTTNNASSGSTTVFVTKLDPTGTALLYSTYLGGSGSDAGYAIAIDGSGDAYVTGYESSPNFPVTPGAFQTTVDIDSGQHIFVTKLNATGTALEYSSVFGGNRQDFGLSIAVDASDNAYLTGFTYSTNFPVTPGAFQTVNKSGKTDGANAFVSKLNPAGTALVYSSYLGGSGGNFEYDAGNGIAVDGSGSAYVTGWADSLDFPVTPGAFQTAAGNRSTANAFVTKFNPTGTDLTYSTYLSSSGSQNTGDIGFAIAVDSSGNAYVTGQTSSSTFPVTQGAFQSGRKGYASAFITKLNPTGTALVYSTYLGGSGSTTLASGNIISVDSAGDAFVTGSTRSTDFPLTSGAIQIVNNGVKNQISNAYVSKFNPTGTALLYSTYIGGSGIKPNNGFGDDDATGIAVDGSGNAYLAGITYSSDFPVTDGAFQTVNNAASMKSNAFVAKLAIRDIGPPALITEIENQPGASTVYGNPNTFYMLGVRITDSNGDGLGGVAVTFTGAGLTFTSPALTDASGATYVTATPLMGGSLTATASIAGGITLDIPIYVTPAPLTVLTGAPERYYGTPNPTLVSRVIGLIGSDTVTVNLQTTAIPASPVGNYPVTATLSGPDAVNYSPTIQEGFLKVVKGPLNVQARNVVSYYGQTPPPITAYFVEGFVNGDTISVVSGSPVLTTTVTSHTDAGFYKIGVDVSQMSAANYYFNPFGSGEGSVEVIKAPLTVTANNQTMPRGGPVPPLTYTLSGFVNGQDATTAGITGAPLLTTPATSASRPGIYPIYVSNGTFNAKNYWASGVTGVLTITP